MKRTGLKLESTASSAESAGPVGKAAKMQEQMFMSAVAECTDFPSFTKRLHPCWVISLTKLATFDELPHHEGGFIYFSRSYRLSTRNTSRFYAAILLHLSTRRTSDAHASTIIAYRRSSVSRRRRNTKIASSSSKNCSPTAQARRAHLVSSSRRTGKVDDWTRRGTTTCAVTRIPIISSTLR